MTNRIGGAALAQTIVKGVVGTEWPSWAVYKVSADTSNGDVHQYFEKKEEAYEYALLMWEDEDVASVWHQKWEWGPQGICLAEMKPDDKEGVRYLVGELEAGRQYAIPYPLMGVGPEFLRVDRGGTIHLMVHAEVDWTQPVYHIPVPLLTKTARLRVAQAQRFGLYSRPKGDYLQAGV